jgi:hypothetical protein
MNVIFRLGLCALATGVLGLTTSLSNADTPEPANAFTKHGLPVPGAYFKNKETSRTSATAAKYGKSVTNTTAAKATKKQAKIVRDTTS